MSTATFDFSTDFSKAIDKFRRALTVISRFMFKCSYSHLSELHAQAHDKLLWALNTSELKAEVLRDKEWLMLLKPLWHSLGTLSARPGILVLTLLPSFYFLSLPFCLVVDIRLCFCWWSTFRRNLGCCWANRWLWSHFCFVFCLCFVLCVLCGWFYFLVFMCFCNSSDSFTMRTLWDLGVGVGSHTLLCLFSGSHTLLCLFFVKISQFLNFCIIFLLALAKLRTILISLNSLCFDYKLVSNHDVHDRSSSSVCHSRP